MNLSLFTQPRIVSPQSVDQPCGCPPDAIPASTAAETGEGQAFVSFLENLKSPADESLPVAPPSTPRPEIAQYLATVQLWSSQFAYIHDVRTNRFFHKGFDTCLGFALDELTADFFVRNLHPADRSTYFNISKALLSFVIHNAPDLVPFTSGFQINYRVQKADGTYISILRQSTPFIKNEKNEVEAYLSICTDISLIADSNRINWTILGPKSETFPRFLAEHLQQKRSLFSDRELEILTLIISGSSSTDISEQLFISANTVNTHRKSLMRKANVNKTVDLIAFARENGYAK